CSRSRPRRLPRDCRSRASRSPRPSPRKPRAEGRDGSPSRPCTTRRRRSSSKGRRRRHFSSVPLSSRPPLLLPYYSAMRTTTITAAAILGALTLALPAGAQTPSTSDKPFVTGTPLQGGPNVKTYGGFRFAESICYDAERDLYVGVNAGIAQNLIPNDGYVTLVNPDGSVHTLKWIGVTRDGLTLNHPLGSAIANGRLYVADIDTLRWFDLKTGAPMGSVTVPNAMFLNDIAVAPDGTVYATQTGSNEPDSWKVYRIGADGAVSTIITGAPLNRPNGIEFDNQGNLVVVNMGHA